MLLVRALLPFLLLLADKAKSCFGPLAAPDELLQAETPAHRRQFPMFPDMGFWLYPRMLDPSHLKRVQDQDYFHGQQQQPQQRYPQRWRPKKYWFPRPPSQQQQGNEQKNQQWAIEQLKKIG